MFVADVPKLLGIVAPPVAPAATYPHAHIFFPYVVATSAPFSVIAGVVICVVKVGLAIGEYVDAILVPLICKAVVALIVAAVIVPVVVATFPDACMLPTTCNADVGLVVPMPTLPVVEIRIRSCMLLYGDDPPVAVQNVISTLELLSIAIMALIAPAPVNDRSNDDM